MNIPAGVSATKTGFELIKSIRELVKRQGIDPGDVSARLLELQELMLDARTALMEAADEKVRLEARIAELTRMGEFGKDFQLMEGVYWRDNVPYCPVCWDVDRKTVRLSGPTGKRTGFADVYGWECCLHKALFGITREKSVEAIK